MNIKESASDGGTSAGQIASVAQPLNYSIQRRLPPTVLFTTPKTSASNVQKKKEDSE